MNDVAQYIQSVIKTGGPISIAEFMRLSLTGRPDSYYMRSNPIGSTGDFITAPEISQVFGECIGLWCADAWTQLGSPRAFVLVELGPGRGTLMRDILRAARVVPDFLSSATIALVEVSPALRDVQAAVLRGDGLPPVRWYDTFQEIDGTGPLIVVANEFFDALPVQQWENSETGWTERVVDVNDRGELFSDTLSGIDAASHIPAELRGGPIGSVFERSSDRESLAQAIGTAIQRSGGAALVIDYGFEGPALGDTFQAVRGHAYADILLDPGMADLTSHVDFSALAGAFADGGGIVSIIATQGDFLKQLGVIERTHILMKSATAHQKSQLESALRRLTAADAMGTLFKVLGVVSAEGIQLAGLNAK